MGTTVQFKNRLGIQGQSLLTEATEKGYTLEAFPSAEEVEVRGSTASSRIIS